MSEVTSCTAPAVEGPGEPASWEGCLCVPRPQEKTGGPRGGQPLFLRRHHVSLRVGLCNVTAESPPPGRIIRVLDKGSWARLWLLYKEP